MFKKIIALIMSIALLLCLAGCGKKTEENKAEEYKSVITDLLDALALGDYDKVESLLYEKSDGEFQKICEKYETDLGFKFADGYEIRRYMVEDTFDENADKGKIIYCYDLHVNFGEFKSGILIDIVDNKGKVGVTSFEVFAR